MLQEIKTYLGKLTLTLKVLMVFIYFLLLLAIGYPLLVKGIGSTIFDEKVVKIDLGPKIVNETLFLAYILIGICVLAIVFYNFFIVNKFHKILDKVSKDIDELTKKNKNSKPFSYKVDFVNRDKLKRIDEYNSVGAQFNSVIKERFDQLKGFKKVLEQELGTSEAVCKELTNLFDEFEKSLIDASRKDMGEYIDRVNRYFHEINENIFKTQLLVFNASIESYKGDSQNGQLPSLTAEIESLTNKNSVLLESINKEIEEHDSKIVNQNENNINKLLEIGRYIAKILYHVHKTIDNLHMMDRPLEGEEFNLLEAKFAEGLALYKKDHQRMDNILKDVWKQFDKSMEDISLISSKFIYSNRGIEAQGDTTTLNEMYPFLEVNANKKQHDKHDKHDKYDKNDNKNNLEEVEGKAPIKQLPLSLSSKQPIQSIKPISISSSSISSSSISMPEMENNANVITSEHQRDEIVLQNLESLYGMLPKQFSELLLRDVYQTIHA
ncbi:MAG: hypothetical protein HQK51_19055 [Oligoflexia bacterium]|nr:hypothetical protein [Oligoflexia bacterium]